MTKIPTNFLRRYPALSLSIAAFLLVGGWLVYEVTRSLTARPGQPGRYAATVEAIIAEAQKDLTGPDAWAEFVAVGELAKNSQLTALSRIGRASTSGSFPIAPEDWPSEEFWPPDPSMIGTPNLPPRVEQAVRDMIAQARSDGVMDALDALASPRRAVRRVPEVRMIEILLPELGQVRAIARLGHARMDFAVRDRDMTEFLSAFEHTLALGRIVGSQSTMIDRLVGYAMANLAMTDLRHAIADGHVDAPTLRLARGVIDRNLPLGSLSTALECERYMMLDTIEWTHSTGGRAIPMLMNHVQAKAAMQSMPTPAFERLVNLTSIVMPSKEQSIRAANTLYDLMIADSTIPPHARPNPPASFRFVEDLSPRYALIKTLAPAVSKALEYESMHITDVAGIKALIALELYKDRHGRYPESLAGLVPEWLDALPRDEFNPAGLAYHLKDPTGPASSAYLLYSFGPDLADNDGAYAARSSPNVAGQDMVYNRRRPDQ